VDYIQPSLSFVAFSTGFTSEQWLDTLAQFTNKKQR